MYCFCNTDYRHPNHAGFPRLRSVWMLKSISPSSSAAQAHKFITTPLPKVNSVLSPYSAGISVVTLYAANLICCQHGCHSKMCTWLHQVLLSISCLLKYSRLNHVSGKHISYISGSFLKLFTVKALWDMVVYIGKFITGKLQLNVFFIRFLWLSDHSSKTCTKNAASQCSSS